jgi:hypothetical protein
MHAMRWSLTSNGDEDSPRDERGEELAPVQYLFGPPEPEDLAMLSEPRQVVRYQQGTPVYATDGLVGTLRQVVIDEETAEVKALVVRLATRKESVLAPPDLVDHSEADALLLNVTRERFAKGASRSPRFEPKMFAAADLARASGVIPHVFQGDARRSLVRVSRDHVETGASLQPPPAATAHRQSWWHRFGRG